LRRRLTVPLFCCAAFAVASGVQAATLTVGAGGNFQAALDAARPGDTILLQAGAVFTGSFKLPAKGGTTYITVRSSAPDGSLPPAGSRITPSSAPLLAKIRSTNAGAAMRTAAGASNWRLLFLEIYPSTPASSADLVEFGGTGSSQSTMASVPQHLIMDRCYLHGDPVFGQRRGVALNSGDAQIVNSYFSDFKGVTQDTQAIAGWNGPGPFLIDNNYLEAAGENILFGGSDPSIPNLVPSHIVIRRNLVTKPLAWMSQAWTVKNLVEFKNADTVLVDGNTIENNWAAGQQGYAILFTPRNQGATAPWSVVKNITVQNNVIRHVAAAFNVLGYDNIAPTLQTEAIVIRNNLAYDISTKYGSAKHPANGWFAVIGAGPKEITIDHNTVDNDGSALIQFYAGASPQIYGFVLTNNLMRRNKYGLFGANSSEGTVSLSLYAPGAIVVDNTFAGAPAKLYPSGNDFPSVAQWLAGFVSSSAQNYQLTPASPFLNAATDGRNLGVDFAELTAASIGTSSPPPPVVPADDIVVYRPNTGVWYTLTSSSNFMTATATQWGISGDIPVSGDYDGDGKTDVAVFRPATGVWYVLRSSTGAPAMFQWGLDHDAPVPGDYDGDGKTDIAIFRPSTGVWYILYSSTGKGALVQWGLAGDVPVPGDYDGDGKADIAIFRPSTGIWYIIRSSVRTGATFQWGVSGDVPVAGDYDGDGKTDIAVYRPSTGIWYMMYSSKGTGAAYGWGINEDVPVPGDYDGDGRTDIVVFRPSSGVWYMIRSSTGIGAIFDWGLSGDIPVRMR
jgi:VCBS repeat protein